jgi:para-nitrobenzyl esterase
LASIPEALAASIPEDEWSELFSADPLKTGSQPIVSIEGLGAVRGRRMGRVTEFYAIYYANARRFEQAVPVSAWSGVRDATTIGPRCFQKHGVGSDDCLHLDIRACDHTEGEALRPVMVWIHGGGYYTGSSTEDGFYNGTNIIEHSDCGIVYASIQYRLNTFGMLDHPSFGSANFGFRDQQLALAWLQNHLHSFGGDKDRVVIAGESAGAGSVSLHLASPLSKGLFSAAIAESTYTPSDGAHLPRSLSQMHGTACVAEACPQAKADSEILSCLQDFDATALTDIGSCNTLMYSVDGWLFEEPVWKTAREGRLTAVPLVIGSQSDEWTFFPVPWVQQHSTRALRVGCASWVQSRSTQ